ncbi:MAG TPA: GNAT family N-acetyltransferase [Candidatus Limnocylindria bacterium]
MDQYTVSTDPARLDRDAVYRYPHEEAYWSQGISRDIFERALDNSLNFTALHGTQLAGFARVVTDRATFAWLCDVFVLPEHRGRGVSRRLMEAVMAHPDLASFRNFLLATRDAHGLYAKFGFTPLAEPQRWMAIRRPYRTP